MAQPKPQVGPVDQTVEKVDVRLVEVLNEVVVEPQDLQV